MISKAEAASWSRYIDGKVQNSVEQGSAFALAFTAFLSVFREGAEVRERWGDDAADAANDKLLAMDEEAWNDMEALTESILEQLGTAMATGDPMGAEAEKLVRMHARWLEMHWPEGTYTPEAHRGMGQMYVADERFRAYYDGPCGDGAAQFLCDAIGLWA